MNANLVPSQRVIVQTF